MEVYSGVEDRHVFFNSERTNSVAISTDDCKTWKWSEKLVDEEFNVKSTPERRGKLAKLLRHLSVDEVDILRVCTAINSGVKQYDLVLSNNFYSHYIKMKEGDICTSCMAYNKDYYNIHMEWGMESPLIAYESDPDWFLALVKERGKEGYPYVARAVYHKPTNRIVSIYGQTNIASKVFRAAGIRRAEEWEYCTSLRLIEDKHGNKILPFIDGDEGRCGIDGDYWTIGDGSWIPVYSTGLGEDEDAESFYCEYCSEHHYEEPAVYDVNSNAVCEGCYDSGEVVFCRTDEEYYPYGSDHITYCEDDGEYYSNDDDTIGWCQDRGAWYFLDNLVYSEYYEAYLHVNDAVMVDDDWLLDSDRGEVWDYDEEDTARLIA
jgi:hypothetical protein